MTKTYRKAIAITAVAVLMLVQGIFMSAGARATTAALADANLTAESQALKSFDDSLTKLETTCADLGKKASITGVEFASAKLQGDNLKSRVSQVRQTIRSIIDKLKAAGEWDGLDAKLLTKITNERVRSLLRDNGGAKKILEDAASQFGGLSGEVDSLVQSLNSKVRAQLDPHAGTDLTPRAVRVGFKPEPAPFRVSFRCAFRTVQGIVDGVRGNEVTPEHIDQMIAACGV